MELNDEITANDVANWFICNIDRESGDSITHLKLQKMLYYAQAWSLVIIEKPLFNDEFEAWSHGPVLPNIYEKYKEHGYDTIPICDCNDNIIDSRIINLLLEVKSIYGEMSAKSLEELTHHESPWIIARGNRSKEERCNDIITKESMINYYSPLKLSNNGQI